MHAWEYWLGLVTVSNPGHGIHIKDAVRILLFAIEHDHVEGIVLAVSPNPVSNKVLTLAISSPIISIQHHVTCTPFCVAAKC
jgi:NAD dependent epimerase/dehydratase family enzyme